MASAQGNASAHKPSFAKIAAAGLKPPSVAQKQTNNSSTSQKHGITSAPRDGPILVTPSNSDPAEATATAKKLVQIDAPHKEETAINGTAGPEVHVHNVDTTSPEAQDAAVATGLLVPAASEDSNTQLSSSSGSVKPPSLDGKSVASGTTFALDEKESLRPDDSASAKAAEDEELFSAPSSTLPGLANRSDHGGFPFGHQLREITAMEPARRSMPPPNFGPPVNPQNAMLYLPPQGPGMGMIPSRAVPVSSTPLSAESSPDVKLLEAIANAGERVHVLKIETDIVDFINDEKEIDLVLPQTNGYFRMLAHKAAEYYALGHVYDEIAESVRLYKTARTRLRPPLIPNPVPSTAASTPPPNAPRMKILRRGEETGPAIVNGSNITSKSTSENGESSNEDDKKPDRPMTREEKMVQYEAARLRIMGSARPSDSSEEVKPKESSRSSSVTGKKAKKKQRNDSDDDFDPRTSYSAYYTPTSYSSDGFTPNAGGLQYSGSGSGSMTPSGGFQGQQPAAFQMYPMQGHGNMQWPGHGYANGAASQQWPAMQQPYDLAGNFQRTMTFQPHAMQQTPNMPTGYNQAYQHQNYGMPDAWQSPSPSHAYQVPQQQTQSGGSFYGGYQVPSASSPAQPPTLQPYQFGQLPSQTYGGRPANKMEHPLPGSYRGKNFNPQSQSFVPGGQNNLASFRPFTPQSANPAAAGYPGGYGVASPLSRQPSGQGQNHGFPSPRVPHGASPQPPTQPQPMVHPLPQPVFPQQPSPSVPLPPKPGSTPQKQVSQQSTPPSGSNAQSQSSIAKWGAPASLPAKPPPPAEPFDPAKFAQSQRQPSYSTSATARMQHGGMPSFGSMPPVVSGVGANGVGGGR